MTTITNRISYHFRMIDAADEGTLAALTGRPWQSCPYPECSDERRIWLIQWRAEVARQGVNAERLDTETELDQTTPQPWRYDLMFWLAAVAVVAFFVTVVYLATKGGG